MQERLIFKNSKGDKLVGILSNPTNDKTKPIIILCHGFSGHKDSKTYPRFQEVLNKKGIAIFRFDFYGHGESDGKFEDITISEALDDVLKAIEFIKLLGYKKIGLFGSSFGGMASILAASKTDDLFILALKSPVSDCVGKIIAQTTQYPIEKWKRNGYIIHVNSNGIKQRLNYSFYQDAENLSVYEAAKNINIPTIIVHGNKDDVVPVEQSKRTASIIKDCRLEILPSCNHQYDKKEDFEKMIKLISRFIVENS